MMKRPDRITNTSLRLKSLLLNFSADYFLVWQNYSTWQARINLTIKAHKRTLRKIQYSTVTCTGLNIGLFIDSQNKAPHHCLLTNLHIHIHEHFTRPRENERKKIHTYCVTSSESRKKNWATVKLPKGVNVPSVQIKLNELNVQAQNNSWQLQHRTQILL